MTETETKRLKQNFTIMCANCDSVKFGIKWIKFKLACLLIDIPKLKLENRISHGICKECGIKLYGQEVSHIFDEKSFSQGADEG